MSLNSTKGAPANAATPSPATKPPAAPPETTPADDAKSKGKTATTDAAIQNQRKADADWTTFVLAALKTPARNIRARSSGGCCSNDVVVCALTDSLAHVFQAFVEHGISSMPVVTRTGEMYAYIGLEDLVQRMVSLFPDGEPKPEIEQIFEKVDALAATTVREMLRSAPLTPIGFIPHDASIWLALEECVRHRRHRVAAATSNECITHIITESMLVAWMAVGADTLMPAAQRVLIRDVKGKGDPVVVMNQTDTALHGFRLMCANRFTGLPVVDATTGALVDVLTVRDLKGVTPAGELLWRVLQPVETFKAAVRSAYPQQTPSDPRNLYLLPTDSLKKAMVMMSTHRVHHLPVVNDPKLLRVEAQVSLSDLLSFVLAQSTAASEST